MEIPQRRHAIELELHAHKDATSTQLVVEYANLMIEDLKNQLVGCNPNQLGRLQGRVTAYEDLVKTITTKPYEVE